MLPKIVYDDREEFPWAIIYAAWDEEEDKPGEVQVWARYRTLEGAGKALCKINVMLICYGVIR